MDSIEQSSNAPANLFRDLPFPDSFDEHLPSAEVPKIAVPDESAVTARLPSSGAETEPTSCSIPSVDPSSSSAVADAAETNQHGEVKRKASTRRSQPGSARSQKHKSAQPRQRQYIKQNPREKEIKQLQELYYEWLQNSHPSEQHATLDEILEQQEQGDARDQFLHQYAEKFRKQEVPEVNQEEVPVERNQLPQPVAEEVLVEQNLLPQPAEESVPIEQNQLTRPAEGLVIDLTFDSPPEQTQHEHTTSPLRFEQGQVRNVSDESVQKPSHQEPAPQPVLDQGSVQVTHAQKLRETEKLLTIFRAQQQREWKNYLEKCTQAQSQIEQLSQNQRDEQPTEEWRQRNQDELLLANARFLVRKQQQDAAAFLARLAQETTPKQSQPQQGGESRKRSREALDSSALEPPSAKRVATSKAGGKKSAAKIRDHLLQAETQQKVELIGQLHVHDVIDALVEHKKKSKRSKQKPLVIHDFIKPLPIPGQQPEPHLQQSPLDLAQRCGVPQQGSLQLAIPKGGNESPQRKPRKSSEKQTEMTQEDRLRLEAQLNLELMREQLRERGHTYMNAQQLQQIPPELVQQYARLQQNSVQLVQLNEQNGNSWMRSQLEFGRQY